MSVYIDRNTKEIIHISLTKASDKLKEMKKEDPTFVFLFTVNTMPYDRGKININFEAFDIPETNRKILTATEYLKLHKLK